MNLVVGCDSEMTICEWVCIDKPHRMLFAQSLSSLLCVLICISPCPARWYHDTVESFVAKV